MRTYTYLCSTPYSNNLFVFKNVEKKRKNYYLLRIFTCLGVNQSWILAAPRLKRTEKIKGLKILLSKWEFDHQYKKMNHESHK